MSKDRLVLLKSFLELSGLVSVVIKLEILQKVFCYNKNADFVVCLMVLERNLA